MNKIKIFFALAIVAALSQSASAQAPIPNGDFEQWSNGAPVDWLVSNQGSFTTITQTSDAESGSSALAGSVISVQGFAQLPPVAISGSASVHGFLYSDRPNSFTGYYKFSPVGGDSISIVCAFKKNGTGIGGGAFFTTGSATSYTAFAVPVLWNTSDAPDTAIVSIAIVTQATGTANVGSTMEVDNLAFSDQTVGGGGGDAVTPSEPTQFNLEQSYPNPSIDASSTTISYSLNAPGYTTLTVYDINGRMVAIPVQEMQPAGNHLAALDCSGLAAGIYTYRLISGNHSSAKMMQVLH